MLGARETAVNNNHLQKITLFTSTGKKSNGHEILVICYGVLIIKKENKVGMRDGKFGWGAYVNRVVRKILGEKMREGSPF